MGRAKVFIPDTIIYKTEMEIRITDLNYGNHLANDKILALAHEARVKFLNYLNYTEADVEGCGIIMADAVIEFKNQGYYGEKMVIKLAIDQFFRKGFELFYMFENSTRNNVLAKVKTGIVFFNYQTQKTANIPEKFIQKIKNLQKKMR